MGVYEFGSFSLDTTEGVLLRSGRIVTLPQKPFAILVLLVEKSGRVVTKEELFQELWPEVAVEDANLTVSMSKIRRVLRERATRPKYIATVQRRGYRFIGKVTRRDEADSDKTIKSLAILPFTNTVNDPDIEYLSKGIADSINNNLSHLQQLRVIARSTIFRYCTSRIDPQEVGRILSVRAVMTGTVQKIGQRLVVSAELVDSRDGSRIWGNKFVLHRTDIFAIEEELAVKISEELRLKLSGEQEGCLAKRSTAAFGLGSGKVISSQSYPQKIATWLAAGSKIHKTCVKGRFYWGMRSEEGLKKAINYFKEAERMGSNEGIAHVGLADCYNVLGFYSMWPPATAFPKAILAASKALSIVPDLAEAHASLGFAKFNHEWNWQAAEESLKTSIRLNPNYSTSRLFHGAQLVAAGRFNEAIEEYQRAVEIEPLSLIANAALGYGYYFARRYDEAIEQCLVATEMEERFEVAHTWLGWAYQKNGMFKEALAQFEEAVSLSSARTDTIASLATCLARCGKTDRAMGALEDLTKPKKLRYVSPYRIAGVHAALGNIDQAFDWLGKAFEEHSPLMVNLRVDPAMDTLHADPRFNDLLVMQRAA